VEKTVLGGFFSLLLYAVVKFRKRKNDGGRAPQVYGGNQVELAWTIIPILIVVALFMATARVIALVQKTSPSSNAIGVTAIGHQFWREYRHPDLGIVTANELHVPVSDPGHPTPTFIRLLSADTVKTFVVTSVANPEHLVEVSRRLRLDGRSHLLTKTGARPTLHAESA
jgi:cytochrome c oxidase subunit 2